MLVSGMVFAKTWAAMALDIIEPDESSPQGLEMLKGEENGDRSVGLLGISVSPDRWRSLAATPKFGGNL